MISNHTCLDGEDRPGEEFDCPECRALMLNSFSEPAREPDLCCTPDLPCEKHWTRPVPPVSPDAASDPDPKNPCHCSSCDPRTCAYCGHPKGKPGCTFCTIEIRKQVDPDRGSWHVWCTGCDWEEKGRYAPDGSDGQGFNHIQLMIDDLGRTHVEEEHELNEDGHA